MSLAHADPLIDPDPQAFIDDEIHFIAAPLKEPTDVTNGVVSLDSLKESAEKFSVENASKNYQNILKTIADESLKKLTLKLRQLPDNFANVDKGKKAELPSNKKSTRSYYSPGKKACHNSDGSNAQQVVMRIELSESLVKSKDGSSSNLTQILKLYGCEGKLVLQEKISAKGTSPRRLTREELLNGTRYYALQEDEESRHYQLTRKYSDTFFEISSYKKSFKQWGGEVVPGVHSRIKLFGKKMVDMSEYVSQQKKIIDLRTFDLNFSRQFNNSYMRSSANNSFRLKIVGSKFFLERDRYPVSAKRFADRFFRAVVRPLTEWSVWFLVDSLLNSFPFTETAGGPINKSRLETELQDILDIINGNTPNAENRIRLILEDALKAIEDRKIMIDDQREDP